MTTNSCEFGLIGAGDEAVAYDELTALGPMSAYLVQGPTITYWRYRYARYTNFVMMPVGHRFVGQTLFGETSDVLINQTSADLLYYVYIVIDLPGIHARRARSRNGISRGSIYPSASHDPVREADRYAYRNIGRTYAGRDADGLTEIGHGEWELRNYGRVISAYDDDDSSTRCGDSSYGDRDDRRPWVHWANAIGQLIIRRAVLIIGSHAADTIVSDYLYMWEELTGKAGKRLREMIGKRRGPAQLIRDARENQRLYVPIPFYFTLTSGNAVPLCAIRRTGVRIQVTWEQLGKCVVRSGPDVEVIVSSLDERLTKSHLVAWVDATHVFLDTRERIEFAAGEFDQLMTQVQFVTTTHSRGGKVSVPLSFSHPIIELIWAVRRNVRERQNNWFNYSGIAHKDPIDLVTLRWDNKSRLSGREARYYRLVQPYQSHTNIPKGFIYCYSFALNAEDPNPCGATNFTMFNQVELAFQLQKGLENEQVTVLVFGRNWNIMRYTRQSAGPLFI